MLSAADYPFFWEGGRGRKGVDQRAKEGYHRTWDGGRAGWSQICGKDVAVTAAGVAEDFGDHREGGGKVLDIGKGFALAGFGLGFRPRSRFHGNCFGCAGAGVVLPCSSVFACRGRDGLADIGRELGWRRNGEAALGGTCFPRPHPLQVGFWQTFFFLRLLCLTGAHVTFQFWLHLRLAPSMPGPAQPG